MTVSESTSTSVAQKATLSADQSQAAAAMLRAKTPPAVAELGELFTRAGHDLALVGGPVRDVFLGDQPGDLDLTTDAVPERVLEITRAWADKTWTVGIEFGTVGLRRRNQVFEITTYRSEAYDRTSRKPEVKYGKSLVADLRRRDFTINAMAARLPSFELVDPFGGLEALRDKVIRTPGRAEDSFSDDPLRILRAARFAARLGFTVADEVQSAMRAMASRLSIVSAERITDELSKLMLTVMPETGLDLLVRTGVAEVVLPELPALRMEVDEHHRHKDVYTHSLIVLRQAIDAEPRYGLGPDLVLRLAAILHDIGKPGTRSLLPGGKVAFHHHEVVGAKLARKRLTELRFSNDVIDSVSKLVELHLRFHGYGDGEWTDSAVRRYVRDAGDLLTRLHALTRADCTTRNARKAARLAASYDALEARIEVLREQEELDKIRPELDGVEIMRVLGIRPGPLVGKAYDYLLELRLSEGMLGQERATAELLAWAGREGLEVPPAAS
jgi:poly(A) polymerase